jgi:hypothetical protein
MDTNTDKAKGDPTKEFFVHTITKDVSLEDCILDLLDNSIDGARNFEHRKGNFPTKSRNGEFDYSGFYANISFSGTQFEIVDNCGGIPVERAKNYAFHFGRRQDAPREAGQSIGLYGIGMKRAVFKIGEDITISSSSENDAFTVDVDVQEWMDRADWDFDLVHEDVWDSPGTKIQIHELSDQVRNQFSTNSFIQRLYQTIARDYSKIISQGFDIRINDKLVKPYPFQLRKSADFRPVKTSYKDDSVEVTITAGMAEIPPDDPAAEIVQAEPRKKVDYYGWFVLCNDRVVLAADQSSKTVWGRDGFQKFHTQYYGFMGLVYFNSKDPSKLPWTTSKRDVDQSDQIYKRAITKMKEVTQDWIQWTEVRKNDMEKAEELEEATQSVSVDEVEENQNMRFPKIDKSPKIEMANIQYRKKKNLVKKVSEAIAGHSRLAYKEVGIKTFDYFVEREVE